MGVNHLTWLVDLKVNGQDGYPRLRELARSKKLKLPWDHELELMLKLFETYGYLNVCPYHVRMYWDNDQFLLDRKTRGSGEEESVLGWTESRWKFVEKMLAGTEYSQHPNEYCFDLHHARQAIGILVSIVADEGREWGGINLPNKGAITNLPNDSIVESQFIVDKRGLTPVAMGGIPKPFLGLTQHIINWQELTVDAALSGDKEMLYQALLACPYVHDMNAAKHIMDELLKAHSEYMPQFKKKGKR